MFSWHPSHRDRIWVALLFLGLATGLFLIVHRIGGWVGLELNLWGYANLSTFCVLILWQLADTMFRPRWIYALFGFEELPLRPQIRLWRRMALLALSLVTVADCVIELTPSDGRPVPASAIAPITVLTAAFLAALGWMYTAFEKERLDRATQTLAAAQAQLSGANILILYNQILELVQHCITKHGLSRDQPLPLAAMATKLGDLPGHSPAQGKSSTTLEDITIQFLNQCEHISLGVREGLFDFRAIRLLLRQRFIRIAFRFSEYIKQQTGAKPERDGLRATSLNWEHFLWLVHHLNSRGDDKIDPKMMILPPRAQPRRQTPAAIATPPRQDAQVAPTAQPTAAKPVSTADAVKSAMAPVAEPGDPTPEVPSTAQEADNPAERKRSSRGKGRQAVQQEPVAIDAAPSVPEKAPSRRTRKPKVTQDEQS